MAELINDFIGGRAVITNVGGTRTGTVVRAHFGVMTITRVVSETTGGFGTQEKRPECFQTIPARAELAESTDGVVTLRWKSELGDEDISLELTPPTQTVNHFELQMQHKVGVMVNDLLEAVEA